jgi:hypothetical protein
VSPTVPCPYDHQRRRIHRTISERERPPVQAPVCRGEAAPAGMGQPRSPVPGGPFRSEDRSDDSLSPCRNRPGPPSSKPWVGGSSPSRRATRKLRQIPRSSYVTPGFGSRVGPGVVGMACDGLPCVVRGDCTPVRTPVGSGVPSPPNRSFQDSEVGHNVGSGPPLCPLRRASLPSCVSCAPQTSVTLVLCH